MRSLLEWLSQSLQGGAWPALVGSFLWGVLSILLSPCHLASIPLIVGFISGQEKVTWKQALALSLAFSIGILITIAAVGAITALMGRMAGDIGRAGQTVVAVVFFLIGLYLLEVVQIPFPSPAADHALWRGGVWAALAVGLFFGLGLGPCTFAYMAPVLAGAFAVGSSKPVLAGTLVLLYSFGHCSVIVAAGTSTNLVQRYLDWDRRRGKIRIMKRLCGMLVMAAGLYLLWSVWG
jgi:cytochrome c-type biogenesis protein